MVRREMASMGCKRAEAEQNLARRAGLAPSAIENLRRGKIKNHETIGRRLQAIAVQFLERQIATLENELAIARRVASVESDNPDLDRAEAAIEEAKRILRG